MKKTCGIFIISLDGLLLVGHPTNGDKWSIPKGMQDDGETNMDTAVRECQEETTILVPRMYLVELAPVAYASGKKTLHPFLFRAYITHDQFNPKCHSMVHNYKTKVAKKDGNWNDPDTWVHHAPFPELDEFRWVTKGEAMEMLHPTQVECLRQIDF